MKTLTHTFITQIVLVMQIGFHTDNRFDALFFHGIVKVYRAKHISMIRHRHRGHALLFYFLGKGFYFIGTIKQ